MLPSMTHWSHCIPQVWRRLKSCHLHIPWRPLRSGEGCWSFCRAKVRVYMPCLYICALGSRCGPKCTGTGVVTSQCTVWMRMHLTKYSTLSKLSIQDVSWGIQLLKSENYPSFKGTGRTFLSLWTVMITSSIVVHMVIDLAANGMGLCNCLSEPFPLEDSLYRHLQSHLLYKLSAPWTAVMTCKAWHMASLYYSFHKSYQQQLQGLCMHVVCLGSHGLV